ncbi:MAG TPA: hypothetical protein VKB35_13740 [Ktedonobacteraceae bacterium]|nr:hypothetical protein [Ktedonobacteraceae bacterium]
MSSDWEGRLNYPPPTTAVPLYGNGDTLIPVTLSFVDVHGNHHPTMILHFQDTRLVYINENGGFRPANPDELPAIEHYLGSPYFLG